MGTQYLIDSNVVIDYLQGRLPAFGMEFMNGIVNATPKLSIITKIEVLGFNTNPEVYKMLTDFFDDARVLPLTDIVVVKTIELRKEYKIKLPDAIIAATALAFNLTLLTRNTSDFQIIDNLVCLDAHMVK